MAAAIEFDHANYTVLRDAVNELQAKDGPHPGEPRPPGRLPLPPRPLLSARSRSSSRATAGRWSTSTSASASTARQQYDLADESYQAAAAAGYDARTMRARPRRGPPLRQPAAGRPGHPQQPLRAHRADGRVPRPNAAPPSPPWAETPRKSSPSTSGPSRSIAITPAPVRAGRGKRPPRQRRGGDGPLQAGGQPLPLLRRPADEPRPDVRGPRAIRPRRAVLSAGVEHVSRAPSGGLVLQGHGGLARAVLRRGRGEEAIASARSSASP